METGEVFINCVFLQCSMSHCNALCPTVTKGVGLQPQGLECPDPSSWWDFRWSMNIRVWAELLKNTHIVSTYVYTVTSVTHLTLPERKKDEAIDSVCVFVAGVCVCVWSVCLCLYGYTLCMCVLGVCACWEHVCSLTAGQTWGYWSTSASPLFSCWI